MKKNEQFIIEITGMTDAGEGVGRAEGMIVFVPYTIVGETVRAHIVAVKKSYAVGKLLEVIKPSTHRIKAECQYFYMCGGCQLWHMDYETELLYKEQKVSDALERIGGIKLKVSPIIKADNRKNYRNKSQFPVTPEGIGMYAGRSHRLIPIKRCIIQSEVTEKIISLFRYWMSAFGISAYDEKSGSGQIRNLYVRETDEGIMVCPVASEREIPHLESLVSLLRESGLPICSLILNINPKNTNVVLGKESVLVWGKAQLIDHLGSAAFAVSPLSFYQVNKKQMKKLYDKVGEYADLSGNETVWDIYCGIGTIGQYLAKDCKKLVGIEIVEDAVKNAKENASLNSLKNAQYYCGAAEKIAPAVSSNGNKPDVVILDPPRKGCDTVLLDTVLKVKPKKIVYVSCKPSTLARDLKYLQTKGYAVQKITPVDMFPATSHVETVVKLVRKTPDAYIDLKLDMYELDLTASEVKATYQEIKQYILDKYDTKVSNLYIAQVKEKYGIIERENYNKPKSENAKQPQCPPEKVEMIEEALRHFKMIS